MECVAIFSTLRVDVGALVELVWFNDVVVLHNILVKEQDVGSLCFITLFARSLSHVACRKLQNMAYSFPGYFASSSTELYTRIRAFESINILVKGTSIIIAPPEHCHVHSLVSHLPFSGRPGPD